MEYNLQIGTGTKRLQTKCLQTKRLQTKCLQDQRSMGQNVYRDKRSTGTKRLRDKRSTGQKRSTKTSTGEKCIKYKNIA